ncbi:aspartate/glutamate racemase family protein [Marinobacter adhaerens]|jgi:aspartate racemase|uniref:Aspartate/glutamate racemase family protein n=2 Tax=Marinobacter adhaerens TaxID=1033846 RepID=A0ABX8IET1_9GAMM|nr:aspartate/glutamate racemase family protein [Marinobacter adhaerens]ADP97167.1 aspartate racemase [Marinobacter adhaerens HP15]MBW4980340.1 aspartate/glutamate racemase family protein [Marinobacter adhaerens]QWV11268.1 aspartate/glutamate racemase family protein [Marinobacter adhaerens]
MKTIGLLGGMSWESTQTYYRLINEGVKNRLGGLHSAKLVLFSVDFAEIEALQHKGDWPATADILTGAALSVQKAGADFLVIGTNTMHKVAPEIEQAIGIPLLHIADATAQLLKKEGVTRAGLLGTRFTMEQAFYRERLEAAGIDVLTPDESQRDEVHRVIYEELCQGEIKPDSRHTYLDIVSSLSGRGAQAVILGCTEIGLLISQADTEVPLYDTTEIHAARAVELALHHP